MSKGKAMQTATITEINKGMFFNHEPFIQQPNIGKCRLVAIHGHDASTAGKYEGYNDSTLISLKPLSGEPQLQVSNRGKHKYESL